MLILTKISYAGTLFEFRLIQDFVLFRVRLPEMYINRFLQQHVHDYKRDVFNLIMHIYTGICYYLRIYAC